MAHEHHTSGSFKRPQSVDEPVEELHTRERTPQFNESNISCNQAATASTAELLAWVDRKMKAGFAIDCDCDVPEPTQYAKMLTALTDNKAVGLITSSCLPKILVPKRGTQARFKRPSSKGCPSRGHTAPIPLTMESLKQHDLLHQQTNAPGIGGWFEGDGPGLRMHRRRRSKPSDSMPAKRSSKPSVSSSASHDWVIVQTPDRIAETIASIGSSFENVVVEPGVDIHTLTL